MPAPSFERPAVASISNSIVQPRRELIRPRLAPAGSLHVLLMAGPELDRSSQCNPFPHLSPLVSLYDLVLSLIVIWLVS